MTGVLCLQGGRELTPACDVMDTTVLARSDGQVVVLAGAAQVGSDYAGASARVVAHYRKLGAEVVVVADPRDDISAALAALRDGIGLVVLPGGSPGGLLDVLTAVDGGSIGRRIAQLWQSDTAVSGASAGAMVMCAQTVQPDRDGGVAAGLGFVDGIAVPPTGRQDPRADGHSPLDSCGACPSAVGSSSPATRWRRSAMATPRFVSATSGTASPATAPNRFPAEARLPRLWPGVLRCGDGRLDAH